jgi:hypothetical protein
MKYGAEMCFIKIGSDIQKLIDRDSEIHRQHGDRISLLSFLKIREVGYKGRAVPVLNSLRLYWLQSS